MDGYNPWAGSVVDRGKSPGELAQKWARMVTMGLKWYFNVALTEGEVEALAKLLARFITETKKKSGVDLGTLK